MAPVCFVVMGFGKKTDLATGRELDLDKSYHSIIKPAVQAAGYQCIRADEVQQSGMIDVPMYKLLYEAELVVADLSTTNPNAIFELGVRHALKPRSTIIIAESKFTIPFDATHIAVRRYEHLGSGIDYDEAIRMRKVLTDLIAALPGNDDPDSPVYTILPRLNAPTMIEAAAPAVLTGPGGAARAAVVGGAMSDGTHPAAESYASEVQTAREALNAGAFALAKKLFWAIYKDQTAPGADEKPKPARPFVVQQLALATYKAGESEAKTGGPEKALAGYAEAENLLGGLDVETTNDPETLGLWSAIHKRRAETPGRTVEEQKADVDKAVGAAERGFIIKRDTYNGTNLAYLLNLRASLSSGDDRIADNVSADRVRKMVVRIVDERLATLEAQKVDPAEGRPLDEERYWIAATKAESLVALGDPSGPGLMQATTASAPAGWMADTTRGQMDKLKALLAKAKG